MQQLNNTEKGNDNQICLFLLGYVTNIFLTKLISNVSDPSSSISSFGLHAHDNSHW